MFHLFRIFLFMFEANLYSHCICVHIMVDSFSLIPDLDGVTTGKCFTAVIRNPHNFKFIFIIFTVRMYFLQPIVVTSFQLSEKSLDNLKTKMLKDRALIHKAHEQKENRETTLLLIALLLVSIVT